MQRWQWMVLVGGVVAVTPATAQVAIEREGPRTLEYTVARRARLGVKVNLQARETDSIGAYVEAVTPGGPAEKAGLRSGDILTRLDGQSLLGGMAGAQEGRSLPGMKLIELAARLDPNDTVSVDYRRGKEMRSATLVTADDDRYDVRIGPEGPRAFAFDFGDEFPQREAEVLFRGMPYPFFQSFESFSRSAPEAQVWRVRASEDNGIVNAVSATAAR